MAKNMKALGNSARIAEHLFTFPDEYLVKLADDFYSLYKDYVNMFSEFTYICG